MQMRDSIGSTRFHLGFGILAAAVLTGVLAHSPTVAAEWPQDSAPAPTTATASWELIDKNLAQLESLIQAGKIGNLGSSAYGIANAFKALAGLSGSLPADKLAEIQSSVKIVGSQVSKLDKAGEHNNPAGVQSNLQALKATLAKARGYYPH
jgi:hypothetical protein